MNPKQLLLQSLKEKGFSKEIISAFENVKRENFIPADLKNRAYEDIPLPIGNGQTISQPFTIATMLSLLELKSGLKILEIGSGCGYVLSLIANIVVKNGKVFGIEVIKSLFEKSKENLKNCKNIKIKLGNGRFDWKENSSWDRIIISAAAYGEIPKPLVSQLKEKGILVAPLGSRYGQSLMVFKKINGKLNLKKEIPGFIFVPLVD